MSYMPLVAVAALFLSNTPGEEKKDVKPPVIVLSELDVEGFYSVKGDDYKGILQITKPEGTQVYLLTQLVNGQTIKGLGVLKGKTMSVSWTGQGIQAAVSVMDFSGDSAKGVYTTVPGNGQFVRETWRLIKINDD